MWRRRHSIGLHNCHHKSSAHQQPQNAPLTTVPVLPPHVSVLSSLAFYVECHHVILTYAPVLLFPHQPLHIITADLQNITIIEWLSISATLISHEIPLPNSKSFRNCPYGSSMKLLGQQSGGSQTMNHSCWVKEWDYHHL